MIVFRGRTGSDPVMARVVALKQRHYCGGRAGKSSKPIRDTIYFYGALISSVSMHIFLRYN